MFDSWWLFFRQIDLLSLLFPISITLHFSAPHFSWCLRANSFSAATVSSSQNEFEVYQLGWLLETADIGKQKYVIQMPVVFTEEKTSLKQNSNDYVVKFRINFQTWPAALAFCFLMIVSQFPFRKRINLRKREQKSHLKNAECAKWGTVRAGSSYRGSLGPVQSLPPHPTPP